MGTTSHVRTEDSAQWWRALSRSERLRRGDGPRTHDPELASARAALMEERLRAYSKGTVDGDLDELRSALHDDHVLSLLGESPESLRGRGAKRLEYVDALREAWSHRGGRHREELHGQVFAEPLRPLWEKASAELERSLHPMLTSRRIATEAFVHELTSPPLEQIGSLFTRCLTLELNIARMEGALKGSDPHERFHDFALRLHDPEYSWRLLERYPALARSAVIAVENWAGARREFAERLGTDIDLVMSLRGAHSGDAVLDSVTFGQGDSHRHGRSVALVGFTDGSSVMYKPRPMSVDLHFQEFLHWVNQCGLRPTLRTFSVVDRGSYGWSEFVEARPCPPGAALKRFHRRQGALLAVLHTLVASDMHFENLIASGEDPVAVDLEALFHTWRFQGPQPFHVPTGAVDTMLESVLEVGVLPSPSLWVDGEEEGWSDLSGLREVTDQLTHDKIPSLDGVGTDQMRVVRRRARRRGGDNTPRPAVPSGGGALEHRDALVAGYREAYDLLVRHRTELLADDGPLAAFSSDEVRVVVRPTQTYVQFLEEIRHPDLATDALERDGLLDALWFWHRDHPCREELVASERNQLSRGDVPVFTTKVASRHLYADGRVVAYDALPRSGWEAARTRIAGLSDQHREQQVWFVEGSLTALAMSTVEGLPRPSTTPVSPTDRFGGSDLIEAAQEIGDRLVAGAITDDEHVCWLGLSLVREQVWQVGPAMMDMFNGLSGIALFLGRLGEVTGRTRYRHAAERAVRTMTAQIDAFASLPPHHREVVRPITGVGAFGDLGSPIYALAHLSRLWDRQDLAERAAHLLPALVPALRDDTGLDVLGGAAGAALVCLSLAAVYDDPLVSRLIDLASDRLVATTEKSEGGLAWRADVNPERPLAGFSHGASGIATALARIDRFRGTRRHEHLVREALAFEDSVFDPLWGNWADRRTVSEGAPPMVAWCHGAGGIGLARVDLIGYLDDDLLSTDLDRAFTSVESTRVSEGIGVGNDCLCHGDTGNIETLRHIAANTNDGARAKIAGDAVNTVLARAHSRGWSCGVPLGVETPGLMPGLSGIGYALLRWALPDEVPSPLLLEAPPN